MPYKDYRKTVEKAVEWNRTHPVERAVINKRCTENKLPIDEREGFQRNKGVTVAEHRGKTLNCPLNIREQVQRWLETIVRRLGGSVPNIPNDLPQMPPSTMAAAIYLQNNNVPAPVIGQIVGRTKAPIYACRKKLYGPANRGKNLPRPKARSMPTSSLYIPFETAVKIKRPTFEQKFIIVDGKLVAEETVNGYFEVHVCPECVDHEPGPMNGQNAVLDCKVVFMKDGKSHGQCMCYSKAHGKRGR